MANLTHPAIGLKRNRYLIARRLTQFGILGLFLLGPWLNIWILKGNLASSEFLGFIPFTEPFIFLQSLLTGFMPMLTALIGVVLVTIAYAVLGGRLFCSWVCPINIVTDTAHYLRQKLGIKQNIGFPRHTRFYLLAGILLTTLLTGRLFYEAINPVHATQRYLIFFSLSSLWGIVFIFLFDLFLSKRGWCSHLCPMGAFYSLLGHVAFWRVKAVKLNQCDNCMDCVKVCPEPQVITPELKKDKTLTPTILATQCTNCARCVEVCHQDIFTMTFEKPPIFQRGKEK